MCKDGTCTACRKEFARDSSRSKRWVNRTPATPPAETGEVRTNFLDMARIRQLIEEANANNEGGGKKKEGE